MACLSKWRGYYKLTDELEEVNVALLRGSQRPPLGLLVPLEVAIVAKGAVALAAEYGGGAPPSLASSTAVRKNCIISSDAFYFSSRVIAILS